MPSAVDLLRLRLLAQLLLDYPFRLLNLRVPRRRADGMGRSQRGKPSPPGGVSRRSHWECTTSPVVTSMRQSPLSVGFERASGGVAAGFATQFASVIRE